MDKISEAFFNVLIPIYFGGFLAIAFLLLASKFGRILSKKLNMSYSDLIFWCILAGMIIVGISTCYFYSLEGGLSILGLTVLIFCIIKDRRRSKANVQKSYGNNRMPF